MTRLVIPSRHGAQLLGTGLADGVRGSAQGGIGRLGGNDQVTAEDDDRRGNRLVDQRTVRLHELQRETQRAHLIAFETVVYVQRDELIERQSFLALGVESVVFHGRRPGDIG
ncbi:hypothetical protein [Methyloceanibacter sp. wino2]|uniref:hypothetical protein n=1 Tax=Methyloceanibacter sp. wino2 TaxID=2170729 RepID=UPI001FDF151A|nr:hypothetical protein [Methyloceanibacter sp. wino2]